MYIKLYKIQNFFISNPLCTHKSFNNRFLFLISYQMKRITPIFGVTSDETDYFHHFRSHALWGYMHDQTNT